MRISYLLGAALALAMVPGAALAHDNDQDCPPSGASSSSIQSGQSGQPGSAPTAQGTASGTIDANGNCVCPPSGTASSSIQPGQPGQPGASGSAPVAQGTASGTMGANGNCACPPSAQPGATAGTGAAAGTGATAGTGGTGTTMGGAASTGQVPPSAVTPEPNQNVTVIEGNQGETRKTEEKGRTGLSLTANGGVEGYTSSLAPRINPGPSWGVTLGAMPTRIVGVELNYVGATNSVKDPSAPDTRIVRNGGTVDLRVNVLPTALTPFVFGGIGMSRASVSNETAGYKDDTFGNVPLGAGLDWKIGALTAGARFTFNYLFNRDFTPATRTGAFGFNDKQGGDSYNGQLQLGGMF